MKYLLVILLALLIPSIYATCSESQININTASSSELDNLIGIGPVKAEAIINTRPFEGIGDLINVYGIGDITLEKIKNQGLACVEEKNSEEEINKEEIVIEESLEEPEPVFISDKEVKDKPEPEIIKLYPQTIKGEDYKENSDKNTYALYGFIIFCILLGFLFIIRRNRFNKNEFR